MFINLLQQISPFIKKELILSKKFYFSTILIIVLPFITIIPMLAFSIGIGISDKQMLLLLTSIIFIYFNDFQEYCVYYISSEIKNGVLEEIWLSPINWIFMLIGWLFVAALKLFLFSFVFFIIEVFFLNYNFEIISYSKIILGLLFLFLSTSIVGIIMSNIVLVIKNPDPSIFFMTNFIPLLSGALYPICFFPYWLANISIYIPHTLAYDLVRSGLLGGNTLLPLNKEILYICVELFVSFIIMIYFFKFSKKRLEKTGSICFY